MFEWILMEKKKIDWSRTAFSIQTLIVNETISDPCLHDGIIREMSCTLLKNFLKLLPIDINTLSSFKIS